VAKPQGPEKASFRQLSKRMPTWKLEKAHEMRLNQTLTERILWHRLRARKLGVKFRRQVPLLGYIADFASLRERIVVEVDGKTHDDQVDYDANRDDAMRRFGIKVVRIPSWLILSNPEGAVRIIQNAIKDRSLDS